MVFDLTLYLLSESDHIDFNSSILHPSISISTCQCMNIINNSNTVFHLIKTMASDQQPSSTIRPDEINKLQKEIHAREIRHKKKNTEKLIQLNLVVYKINPLHNQEDSHKYLK